MGDRGIADSYASDHVVSQYIFFHRFPFKHFQKYLESNLFHSTSLQRSVFATRIQHKNDVIMSATASQITVVLIVYSTVCSSTDQNARIHRWVVNSPHKGPVTRKMFSFDDAIICPWSSGAPGHRSQSTWPYDPMITGERKLDSSYLIIVPFKEIIISCNT